MAVAKDGPETPSSPLHSPDIGYKTGWTNPLMFSGGSGGGQLGAGSSSPGLSKTTANDSPLLVHRVRHKNVQQLDDVEMSNVVTMVCFATALMENLARINRDAFQEFRLRIGIAIGPVIAGVVGASKPTYDIWGDTVNVASRLESSGVLGRIHVTEQVAQLLLRHGEFELDCRGPIEVKGKGRLTTYLVVTPFDCTDLDRSADPQDATELGLDEALELEPPPTLEAGDEVEELCADEEH